MGFFTVSFQHWLMGTFSYIACFFTYCISSSRPFRTKTGSNHPPLASSRYFPSRIDFSSCRICPPSLLRLRLFSIWSGQVKKGPNLCSTCYVHRGGCVVCVANLLPKARARQAKAILRGHINRKFPRGRQPVAEDQFADLRVHVVSSPRLDRSTRLAICGLFVKKLSRSPSRLSLALPSAWKTSCLHSKRIMHRERELRCVATEIVQEPGSSLICSWYKTVQNSMHLPYPMTSFGRFLRISHKISR